jgi:WD40 repeat protein
VAVSAFSPPAASELAEVLGIDPDYRFPEVLQPIAAFFTVNDGAYAVFHGSLSDWLTSRDAANQGAAGKYSISVTAGHERWSQYWLRKFDAGDLPSSLVRSLPAHLAGAGRWDDGARVVLDPHFIAAKIGGLTTTALDLQADCTMLLARLPASHSSRPLIAALNHVIVRQGQNLRRADLSPLDQLILQARLDKSAELAAILEGASPEARDRFELKWSTYAPDPTFRRPWRLGSSDNYLLSISADGGRALCGGGGNLILLDLVAGEVAQRINAHAKGVNACLLSAAGTRAVTQPDGSSDLHVWDVPLLQRARTLRLHRESPWPWGLAMSADGRLLVTCNQGNRTSLLTLWDLDDGHAIRVFKKPGLRRASCAAIAGGASKLLSAHDGGHLVLWDLEGGVIDMVRVDHDGPLTECDISSDGALALAGGGQTLAVWDLTARRVWERPDGAWGEMALALSADGRCALSGGSDGLVVVWNLDPKSPLRALSGNTRNDVWCVASSADGRRGLSSTKGGNTVEWDLQNTGGHAPAAAGHGDWIWRCTISADGHRSATLSGQRLTVWDNRSGRAVRSLHVSDGHYWAGLALNASGSRASFTNGLEVKYWNLETPKELPVPDAESPQLSAEVDDENLWTRFGIVPPRAFHVEGHEGAVRKLELDGSGQLLYASSNGQLGSWLVRDRTQRAPIPVTGDSVEYCTLTDPDTLLVVSDDGTVMLWDLRAERIRASICIGEVTCATGTRDGSLVLLGNGFGDVFALGRCVNTPSAMEDDFFAPRSPRGARV